MSRCTTDLSTANTPTSTGRGFSTLRYEVITMQTIGPYQLLEELGRGAMGVVFHGFDPAIGRPVAVKIIQAGQFTSALEDAELKLRFAREASAAGRLSHPNIVTIYQFGEESGVPYLVQELVNGRSLRQVLSNHQPQDRSTAVSILSQVADALDYAHGEGVVHRDIKPANILVRPDGKVKITDFGIAHIATETVTRTGFTLGTSAYMSPEQIMSARVSGKTDQFSLAVTAYHMLSGRRPFTAESYPALMYQIVSEEPQPLHTVNPAVSVRTSEVISRALAKKPEDRFASCTEFAERLAESLNTGVSGDQHSVATETTQLAAGGITTPERNRRRSRVELWVASGLAVLGLAWVAWVKWPQPVPVQLAEKSGAGVFRPIERSSRLPLPEEKAPVPGVADHRSRVDASQPSEPKPTANPPSKTGSPSPESGRQHPAQFPSPAVTAMKSGRQSQPAVSAPVGSNAPPSKQAAPAVKSDPLVAGKQSQSRTKMAAAPQPDSSERQVYSGPKEGRLVWTGELEPGEAIDFSAKDAAGSVSGSLPGVPVSIEVHPTSVHVVTSPAAANQWRRLVVRNDGKKQPVVLVNWTVVPR